MPVIAAEPVMAPQHQARLCPHCHEAIAPGVAVICVKGISDAGPDLQPYAFHAHPWSIQSFDEKIREALRELLGSPRFR